MDILSRQVRTLGGDFQDPEEYKLQVSYCIDPQSFDCPPILSTCCVRLSVSSVSSDFHTIDMLIRLCTFAALIFPFAYADVKFTSPAAGATFPAGSQITVTWADSGVAPPLSSLSGYSILLMVGGDTVATSVGRTKLRSASPSC